MTRGASADLGRIVTGGSFSRELVADVFYGQTRTYQDLPIDDWSFTGDLDAKIKTAGSATVTYQGEFADSLKPRDALDLLAPFGQELRVYMIVRAGDFEERVPWGTYRIDEVPDAYDQTVPFASRTLTVGSRVELNLVDRFDAVDRARFRSLEQPLSLTSAWAEIARVSRLQVTRTVPDVAIPSSVVYARNRLEAVQQLAALLGGRAVMLYDGTLGVVPDTYGAPVLTLQNGERGTVISAGYSLASTDLANVVYIDTEDAAGNPIHEEAFVSAGPLAIDGPFGERVVEYPSDQTQFIKTREAARTAVRNHLAKVSAVGTVDVPVTLVPDPRIELGDVVTLQQGDESQVGRVWKYGMSRRGAMTVTVRTA